MEAAHLGDRNHAPSAGRLDVSGKRSIPLEREVRPGFILVMNVGSEDPAEGQILQDDVETVLKQGSKESQEGWDEGHGRVLAAGLM